MTNNPYTKKFLVGIDIGSSKTHAMLADKSGHVLGFTETGCGNYEAVGIEGMSDTLIRVITLLLEKADISKYEILSIGLGIAGYDWPSEKPWMDKAIVSLGIDADFAMVNDVEIGLIAGASDGWGIAVDAGTGNNIRGRNKDGNVGRITGNSILFGEFGGASEIVWSARVAATFAWTQRGPKTKITSIFMDFTEVESEEALIEGLAMRQFNLPPILAIDIIKAAIEGDLVAKDVVQFNARELAKNVNAVIKQLNLQQEAFDIVLIGSLFKADEIYLAPFSETIYQFAPHARLVPLDLPPVVGAVLLAAEEAKITSSAFRDNVRQTAKDFLEE